MKTTSVALLLAAAGSFAPAFAATTVSTATTAALATGTTGDITVTSSGSVTVSNTSQVINFNADATLDNSGVISNTNAGGRTLRANTAGTTVSVINRAGAQILGNASDGFQVGQSNINVSLVNSGLIRVANGGQAIDWNAITTGTNTLTNNAGGQILAKGSDSVRIGANGVIDNAGTISTTLVMNGADADSSDGIDAQDDRSGVVIHNFGTGVIEGRHAITGGAVANPNYTMSVTNDTGGVIRGLNGAGINIDGLYTTAVVTVNNSGRISGNVDNGAGGTTNSANGDGDGVDVDGIANITNFGRIEANGAKGVGSDGRTNIADGVSIGGGSVDNKAGAEIFSVHRGILADNSGGGSALAAITVTNAGTITAQGGAAIVTKGAFANTITNSGAITGGGTYTSNTNPTTGTVDGGSYQVTQAAIELQGGDNTLNNSGTITANNGMAVRLGTGNDTINITCGAIHGSLDGGTGLNVINVAMGAGNFRFESAVRNFRRIAVTSGTATIDAAATLVWSFTGNTLAVRGTDFDAVNVTGGASFVVASGATLKILNLAAVDYTSAEWDANRSFVIVDAAVGVLTGDFTLDLSEAGNTAGQGVWSVARNGNTIVANWTVSAVPESSTYGLLGAGALAATALVRRRRRVR